MLFRSALTAGNRTPEQAQYLSGALTQFWDAAGRIFDLARAGREADARDQVRDSLQARQAALTTAVEGAEDSPQQGAADLAVTANDAVIGIAASGRTPYVLGALAKAREAGALTGCIVCVPDSAIAKAVEFPIEVVTGAEVVTGSTRLRAGTTTKLVLNMISTAVMVKLGHVLGNLMVNVQPTNQKLIERARRIIREVTGVSEARAAELLEQSGRSVRTAIMMEKKGLTREAAIQRLAECGGRLRAALD